MLRRVQALTFVGLAAVLVLSAQPALAYTELGTTGTVGAHSLVDTSSSPGAVCKYAHTASSDWKLKRIYVEPPRMRGVPGQGNEKVAWRYTIQRRQAGVDPGGIGPWKDRFTSTTFIAHADSAHNAAFSEQSASVSINYPPGSDVVSEYRAIVTLTWYNASDGVLGTARDRVDWYTVTQSTAHDVEHHACPDYTVPI